MDLMDWPAAHVSLSLASLTALSLLPAALWLARWLAASTARARPVVEAALLLPLLLPPTVIGFYLLASLGDASPFGRWMVQHTGLRLVFSFEGLLFASWLINLPFMVQPLQRAFAAIPRSVREAAWVSGLSGWRTFWRIELPLAWPGVLAGVALTFAHTLGEFGVVLMVGGNIAGETRTLSIAIYDRVQAFDTAGAQQMSMLLVAMSLAALALVFALNRRNPLQER
jgi:molybdate transport system permease protein